MENRVAMAVLETLAAGVNPETGEVFPLDSPYQQARVVRALFHAIECCKSFGELRNVGKPWTEDDDNHLRQLFASGERSIPRLAHEFGRTAAGIEARLERHGLVTPRRGGAGARV
jgi:hypothetical protein